MSNRTIYSALTGAGMTKEGACALMGNMRAESRMIASNVEDRSGICDSDYTARADNDPSYDFAGDNGAHYGYGLCQWTSPERKAQLLACARNKGVSVGDEDMQVQFCIAEMMCNYPKVWAMLTMSHDLFKCTQLVCTDYERPAHNNVGTRYEYAQEFYAEFAQGIVLGPQENHSGDASPNVSGAFALLAEFIMTEQFRTGFLDYARKKEGR